MTTPGPGGPAFSVESTGGVVPGGGGKPNGVGCAAGPDGGFAASAAAALLRVNALGLPFAGTSTSGGA